MTPNHSDNQCYKALLFDLDGTLLDSVPNILAASEIVYRQMGVHFNETEVKQMIGIPLEEQSRIVAGPRADEFLETYRSVYRELPDSDLFPNTRNYLQCLKTSNFRLGLVTSKMKLATLRALKAQKIDSYFECIVTADDVTHFKPHPEPVLKAMQIMEISAQETLFVGDSVFDIQCGHAAGVAVAAVTWGSGALEELAAQKPELLIRSWKEFASIVCPFPL